MPWACSSRFFLKHLRRDSIVRAAPNAALGPAPRGNCSPSTLIQGSGLCQAVECNTGWDEDDDDNFLDTIGLGSVFTKKNI